jgi:Putative GTPases (G3E family)
MAQPTVLLIGGFLGAGKTTLLSRAAEYLVGQGKKVGLITNDQASEMVDTRCIAGRGLPVREVSGSCFCCNFNALVNAIDSLIDEENADIVLAESVGSCTDLSATIMQPLKDKYSSNYILRPISVLVDPLRLAEVYPDLTFKNLPSETRLTRLHQSAGYVVRKQMEETDILLINKKDLLSPEEEAALITRLEREHSGTTVISISAAENKGIAEWLDLVFSTDAAGTKIAEIDYDI